MTPECIPQAAAWFSKALQLCTTPTTASSGCSSTGGEEEPNAEARHEVEGALCEAMTKRGGVEAAKEGCDIEKVRWHTRMHCGCGGQPMSIDGVGMLSGVSLHLLQWWVASHHRGGDPHEHGV